MRMGKLVHEYVGHEASVTGCALVSGGSALYAQNRLLATSSADGSLRLWRIDAPVAVASCDLPGSGPLSHLFSFSDRSYASLNAVNFSIPKS